MSQIASNDSQRGLAFFLEQLALEPAVVGARGRLQRQPGKAVARFERGVGDDFSGDGNAQGETGIYSASCGSSVVKILKF